MREDDLNILLVDDSPADSRLVCEMLKECGGGVCRVERAARLDDALKMLWDDSFDVVLLDVNLPDSGGLEGLEKIAGRYPEAAVILLTGMDDESLAVQALRRSACDYLVKGRMDPGLLGRSIRYAIGRKQAEEVLRRDKETLEAMVAARTKELLSAQKELENARRLSDIGTLAATVAHELRNPLAAITMAAFNIKRKAADPLLDRHFRNIDKKICESNQIINNLLFYSRLKPPQYELIDLKSLLEECVNTARTLSCGKNHVAIELHAPKRLAVEADSLQMREVCSNILGNACDAVAAVRGGRISVRAEQKGSSVAVRFEDTGPGIPAELAPKIFEPFFTTKAKGTGLGLFVCKQILDLHGGAITVGAAQGGGTAVTVTLPGKRER